MKRTLIVILAVCTLGGAACSSDSSSDETTTTEAATTTPAADGGEVIDAPGPIDLAVGERATIRLEANPTTGYSWEPAGEPDEAVITVVSDKYEAADSNVVGGSGTQEIVIEAVGAGTTTVELRYVRPWEEGVAPAETASYAVTVS